MIVKEIVLPAPREEVWEALTEPERLEDWFANDVDLDLRPGGGASFRWANGEERHATVTEVEPERRLSFDWDDEPCAVDVVARVEHRARAAGVRLRVDPLNLVFGALADPSRRQVIGYLAERGTATATELTGELPMTRQAVSKHLATLADAGLVEAERRGRETRYRLTEAGEEWDDRLDALRRHLERRRS